MAFRRLENLGNPRFRARKKPSYSRVASLDSFGENDFFPGQIFGHTRTDLSSFPSPFSITWSSEGGRSHAFLSDKAKKKLVMARGAGVRSSVDSVPTVSDFSLLFTWSNCHRGDRYRDRRFPSFPSLTGSPIFGESFNEEEVYSPPQNLSPLPRSGGR